MKANILISLLILFVNLNSVAMANENVCCYKNDLFSDIKDIKRQEQSEQKLLPPEWNPKLAGDEVLKRLITVTASQVRGAHDAEMVLVGNYAYIVAEVNDIKAGENSNWPFIYIAMAIVNIQTLNVEKIISVAKSDQVYDNETLPTGACFVPRIINKDDKSLRCYFSSENPAIRQSQTWYIDFSLTALTFENTIYPVKLKTSDGIFDMQPRYFHDDAVKNGFRKGAKNNGLYIFDSFKIFDGKIYVAINNFSGTQNALAVLNDSLDTFEIVGHYNEPQDPGLSESSVNRFPDGTWMAICRQDGGSKNYMFTTSPDGKNWTCGEYMSFVPNGTNSKPTFDKFNGLYYLGWQESTKINGVERSVFNVDISRDGQMWEHKYRFETEESFQYPSFHEHNESIWLVVTQGNKQRIMFGRLE